VNLNKFTLITTIASVTETLHLLNFNRNAQIDFLEWINRGGIEICNIEQSDFIRIKELTEKYKNFPMNWIFTDFYGAKKYFASCVAGSRPPPYSLTEIKAFTVVYVSISFRETFFCALI